MTTHTINTNKPAGSSPCTPEAHQRADFAGLLEQALNVPGIANKAYRAFHNFSIGNQMLAAQQLMERGLGLSPLASFRAWQDKGRMVKKGQKAISLYMPVTIKKAVIDEETGEITEAGFRKFIMRPHWFSLEQTKGEDYSEEIAAPLWNSEKAMLELNVGEEEFSHLNGNVLGYAKGRTIAVNSMNPLKHKTRFHELAHVVLGHTNDVEMTDAPELSRNLMEVEAESVAYLLVSILDMPGQAESRHYIQGWLDGETLPEPSAKRIFSAADKILKAGIVN
ncbi:hypothetical protein MTYP_00688 [Methylophilaceae bacterium]|nr:hypothetical protein MTYP_00688 [Methylophilaceae bacterium]